MSSVALALVIALGCLVGVSGILGFGGVVKSLRRADDPRALMRSAWVLEQQNRPRWQRRLLGIPATIALIIGIIVALVFGQYLLLLILAVLVVLQVCVRVFGRLGTRGSE